MTGLTSPQDSGAWRTHLTMAAAAVVVCSVGVLLLSDLPESMHRLASGAGVILGGLATADACRYQAVRTAGRRRPAWILLGVAATIGTLGNVWLLINKTSMGPNAGVALGDLSLVLALMLGVIAVIVYPAAPRRPTELARIVLDGLVIGGSILIIASLTLFPQIIGPEGDLASRAVPLLVPVIDIVLVSVAGVLFLRGRRTDGPFLGLLSAAFALFAVSDFAAAISTVTEPFSFGSVTDLGWIAGYFVIALAIRFAVTPKPPSPAPAEERSPLLATVIIFSIVVLAAVISLFGGPPDQFQLLGVVLWLLVTFAVVARQILLVLDNDRLRRDLEQRVIERSRDLRAATQQTDLLVNSVGEGIYGVDRAGVVTFVNPAAARLLGYEPVELIGQDAHLSFHAPPDADADDRCYVIEAIRDQVVTNGQEDTYVRADGRHIPVEVTATPVVSEGAPLGAVVVFRDITQRREVDRLKGEFVSVVSHELRTPLTSIRGSLGLLAAGSLGELAPPAQRMASIALDSSTRLARLINDILDLERIGSGMMPLEVADHSCRHLITSAVEQVQLLAAEVGVTVEIGAVDGWVRADADRVQQTLINLLDNAIKFSPPKATVEVSAALRGGLVEFTITDQGRGVPPEKLDTIFHRFEQVDSSDARDKGGSGLGLAISRSIVERLGGRIWAENNPLGGTTFRFTLPRATPHTPANASPAELSHRFG